MNQRPKTKQEYTIQHPLVCVTWPVAHLGMHGVWYHTHARIMTQWAGRQCPAPPHHARSPSSSSQMIGPPLASAVRLNPSADLRAVHVPQRPVVVVVLFDCFFSAWLISKKASKRYSPNLKIKVVLASEKSVFYNSNQLYIKEYYYL
jgi:hypothetical protein